MSCAGISGALSAGLRTCRHYAHPTYRRFPTPMESVLDDGFRSCLPLRGSPGFAPGSLFMPASIIDGTTASTDYSSTRSLALRFHSCQLSVCGDDGVGTAPELAQNPGPVRGVFGGAGLT